MKVKTIYKYRKANIIYCSSKLLPDSQILNKTVLLFPDYQYDLIDCNGNNVGQCVELKGDDKAKNYTQKKWKSYDLDKTDEEIMRKIPIEKLDAQLVKMLLQV